MIAIRSNQLTKLAIGTFVGSILGSIAIASPSNAAAFVSQLNNPVWTTSGDVVTTSTTASLSNAFSDGSDDATNLNLSGTDPTSALGPLQTFLGVSSTALNIGGTAQEGSAIRQMFDAVAGDTLSFNLTVPVLGSAFPDYGFVLLNGVFTTFTGATTFNSGVLAAGVNTISIGVVDINDSADSTQIGINSVNYVSVGIPFEFSPTLGLVSLGGLWGLNALNKKRIQKKVKQV